MIPFRRISVCGIVGLLASGCYAYAPVDPQQVRVDDAVRARISAAHARELDPVLMRDARVIEGTVIETGPSLLLQVPVGTGVTGPSAPALHQRVHVPLGELATLELRTLDRTRTGLLVGGAAAVALGIVVRALTGQGGGDPRPNPPGPDEARLPLRVQWIVR